METSQFIRIPGLSKLDYLELKENLENIDVRFEDEKMKGGQHGELLTTAVILLSISAVKLLGLWLVKNRDRNRIKKKIEIIGADGSRRIENIDIDLSSSKSPESDVIGSLAKMFDIDPKLVV